MAAAYNFVSWKWIYYGLYVIHTSGHVIFLPLCVLILIVQIPNQGHWKPVSRHNPDDHGGTHECATFRKQMGLIGGKKESQLCLLLNR